MGRPVIPEFGDNNTNDHHADKHDHRAHEKHRLSADFIDNQLQLSAQFSKL